MFLTPPHRRADEFTNEEVPVDKKKTALALHEFYSDVESDPLERWNEVVSLLGKNTPPLVYVSLRKRTAQLHKSCKIRRYDTMEFMPYGAYKPDPSTRGKLNTFAGFPLIGYKAKQTYDVRKLLVWEYLTKVFGEGLRSANCTLQFVGFRD